MTKRKDGRWMDSVTINGKRRYFYGKTKAEVAQKVREATNQAKAGKKFPAVADLWWEAHEPTIAPNTTKGYIPAMNRAKKYFEKYDIAAIRPVDVARFLNKVIKDNNMAEKTAKTQLTVCNLIFRHALMEEGLIDENPCADITVQKGLRRTYRDCASDEDVKIVLDSVDKPFGLFALIMLTTGLRDGEVLALQGKVINLQDRYIAVRGSIYWVHSKPRWKLPKTDAGIRKVPIMDVLFPYLPYLAPDEYLFGGDAPLGQHQFEEAWKKYVKATGITCTPYQLRHSFATMLMESGLQEFVISKLIGHAQVSTTQNTYEHLREAHAAAERKKIIDMKVV